MKPYAGIRAKCPACEQTFELAWIPGIEGMLVTFNRGHGQLVDQPEGWILPEHRYINKHGARVLCLWTFALVKPGR